MGADCTDLVGADALADHCCVGAARDGVMAFLTRHPDLMAAVGAVHSDHSGVASIVSAGAAGPAVVLDTQIRSSSS